MVVLKSRIVLLWTDLHLHKLLSTTIVTIATIMNGLPDNIVEQEQQIKSDDVSEITADDLGSGDLESTFSDFDYVEFAEWDALANKGGEVPPPKHTGNVPSRAVSQSHPSPTEVSSLNPTFTNSVRMGCKTIADLKRRLLETGEGQPEGQQHRQDQDTTEGDAEVQVVPLPVAKRPCLVKSSVNSGNDKHESEVHVVGVIPGLQLPHPRHGCTNHRFDFFCSEKRSSSWTDRTVINMKHCSMCYCYVCEVKADECIDFEKHCNANDRDDMKSYWKFQRHRKHEDLNRRHFRFQCAVHMFRCNNPQCPWPVEMWEQRSWFNKRFCRDCVCYVCNVPVADCDDWSEHCKFKQLLNSDVYLPFPSLPFIYEHAWFLLSLLSHNRQRQQL